MSQWMIFSPQVKKFPLFNVQSQFLTNQIVATKDFASSSILVTLANFLPLPARAMAHLVVRVVILA